MRGSEALRKDSFSNGETAIVTGASRGIGRAIALELARLNARCIVTGRDEQSLLRTVAEIQGFNAEARSIALDLRLPESAAALTDFALAAYGHIDILVNNAGAAKRGHFLELTDDDWADGFALKFFGAMRLSRCAWPHLKAAKGSLLNISGTGGRTPGSAFAIGGSVNAAMQSFTKALAELGIADGVQVNVLNPGPVRTARLAKRLQDLSPGDPPQAERMFIESERMSRIGEPEDIAALAAFIVGPRGRFLHGAMIDMDGGATKTL
jgi:NAD(P)-dependent dehydrogenase (short-subunit alcohol dehydrogenase family)